MKAFTDIEQSKKLAKILPIESADMHYNNVSIKGINYVDKHRPELMEYNKAIKVLSKYTVNPLFEVIPCWSFAALLNIIPKRIKDYNVFRIDIGDNNFSAWYDEIGFGVNSDLPNITMKEPVDACYEFILKLHKLNLL